MKKMIGLIIIMVLVVIMLTTYIKNQVDNSKEIDENAIGYEIDLEKEGLEKGQLAPDFTLKTLSGETFHLSDLKGKKVVLNFWATWCPPCKIEMPHLQEYHEQYAKEEDFVIVGVNLTHTEVSKEKVKQFVDSYELTFPILLMEEKGVDDLYQILTIPSTFMIDSEGRIQNHIVGPLDQNKLEEYVSNLK